MHMTVLKGVPKLMQVFNLPNVQYSFEKKNLKTFDGLGLLTRKQCVFIVEQYFEHNESLTNIFKNNESLVATVLYLLNFLYGFKMIYE